MRNCPARPLSSAWILLAACAFVLVLSPRALLAQTGGTLNPPSSADPGIQSDVNRLDMSEREFAIRNQRHGGNRLLMESQQKLLYAQIKEDFERIQVVNKELVKTLSAGPAPDYKRVTTLSGEIRKRAARLKLNLALPEIEDASKQKQGSPNSSASSSSTPPPGLDKSIVLLDHAIESFVSSPLFKHGPGVLPAEHVARTTRALNSVIEVSERIRKAAAQADKSAK